MFPYLNSGCSQLLYIFFSFFPWTHFLFIFYPVFVSTFLFLEYSFHPNPGLAGSLARLFSDQFYPSQIPQILLPEGFLKTNSGHQEGRGVMTPTCWFKHHSKCPRKAWFSRSLPVKESEESDWDKIGRKIVEQGVLQALDLVWSYILGSKKGFKKQINSVH